MTKIKREKSNVVYFMSYGGKRIFYDKENNVYSAALRRDGTDDFFSTLDEVFNAIDNRKTKKLLEVVTMTNNNENNNIKLTDTILDLIKKLDDETTKYVFGTYPDNNINEDDDNVKAYRMLGIFVEDYLG